MMNTISTTILLVCVLSMTNTLTVIIKWLKSLTIAMTKQSTQNRLASGICRSGALMAKAMDAPATEVRVKVSRKMKNLSASC